MHPVADEMTYTLKIIGKLKAQDFATLVNFT